MSGESGRADRVENGALKPRPQRLARRRLIDPAPLTRRDSARDSGRARGFLAHWKCRRIIVSLRHPIRFPSARDRAMTQKRLWGSLLVVSLLVSCVLGTLFWNAPNRMFWNAATKIEEETGACWEMRPGSGKKWCSECAKAKCHGEWRAGPCPESFLRDDSE